LQLSNYYASFRFVTNEIRRTLNSELSNAMGIDSLLDTTIATKIKATNGLA